MLLCIYCKRQAEFRERSAHLYHGRDYGAVWECAPCGAWVGVHKGTRIPLGRLANAELRQAKIDAHAAFDPLWRRKMARDRCSVGQARGAAYQWLAQQMGLPVHETHIGMFDLKQCRRVIELCRPHALKQQDTA